MSEWKTWSLGEPGDPGDERPTGATGQTGPTGPTSPGGSGAAPGATPAGTPFDEAALRWGTEVAPFDLDRLQHVMGADGFPLTREEFAVSTAVDQTPMRVHREPAEVPWLQVESRLPVPAGDGAATELSEFELQQVANTWNSSHLQPTVFASHDDGGSFFVLVSRFFVGAGLSDRQIHLMVRRAVVVALQAGRELPGLIPPLDTTAQ